MPSSHCRTHAGWARRLSSPLYDHLLTQAADDYDRGGPLRDLLEPHRDESAVASLPLRMMGAVHRLVLSGKAPELARYYPSAGGTVDLDGAWRAFRVFVAAHREEIEPLLPNPVQTNDAGRSGSLLGGFLLIAGVTGLPLRLLEVGSSAGLNLCWDRYRYTWNGGGWGNPASSLTIEDVFVNGSPASGGPVSIASRTGCDPNPVDATAAEGRLTLFAYTWPDHVERFRRLGAAMEIARGVDYKVEQASAADWLEEQLAHPVENVASVVYHSVVWPYLSEQEKQRMTQTIENSGERASAKAPLAWLRLEPGGVEAELRLRVYPGIEERVIATSGFHSPAVRWLG